MRMIVVSFERMVRPRVMPAQQANRNGHGGKC
jgi:hypothetical protein